MVQKGDDEDVKPIHNCFLEGGKGGVVAMDSQVTLNTKDGDLLIKIRDKFGWSSMLLIKNVSVNIGSERIDYITKRLVKILDVKSMLKSMADKTGVDEPIYVLGLSEGHRAIYANKKEKGLLLLFEDVNGKEIDTLYITDEECKQWKDKLAIILHGNV